MDVIRSELERLAGRTDSHATLADATVQALIERLEAIRAAVERDPNALRTALPSLLAALKRTVQLSDSHKEWHAALGKLNKSIDKAEAERRFTADLTPLLPTAPPADAAPTASSSTAPQASTDPFGHMYFASPASSRALDAVIATHFVRQGHAELARCMQNEGGTMYPDAVEAEFAELHIILAAMREDDLGPALAWADAHADFLAARSSPLAFRLHRSQYVRLLLSDSLPLPTSLATPALPPPPPLSSRANGHAAIESTASQGPQLAYAYAREHFQPFLGSVHAPEIQRLMCAALFLPLERLLRSPYADIFAPTPDARARAAPADDVDGGDAVMADGERPPSVASRAPAPTDPDDLHAPHLVPLFTAEYCAFIKRSREPALKVATDIGGGGALSRIAKVRSVMKERRTEWTQAGELPIEIPLPPEYRFHSVFSCPVSKEQASDVNPPMMLGCGHVIAKESLAKLSKGGHVSVKFVVRLGRQELTTRRCPYCPQTSTPSAAVRLYF